MKIKALEANLLLFVLIASSLVFSNFLGASLVLIFGNGIFYPSLSKGCFFLFMALGAFLSKRARGKALLGLFFVELALCALGATSGFAFFKISMHFRSETLLLVAALFFSSSLGLLSGSVLPLLAEISPSPFGHLLIFGYAGALLASFFDSMTATLVAAAAAWAGALFLALKLRRGHLYFTTAGFATLLLISFAMLPKFGADTRKALFSLSPNTKLVASKGKVVVTLTPNEDIEPDRGVQPELVDLINEISDEKTRAHWISIYSNGIPHVFSPFKSITDFYHHPFVHPAMMISGERKDILILGGGNGLVAKEVLKHPDVESVIVVDDDRSMLELGKTNEIMREHSGDSLNHAKVQTIASDPFRWVRETSSRFDVILVDYPDTVDETLARSYSTEFLKDLKHVLNAQGVISFQVDQFDKAPFWNAVNTIVRAGFYVIPHHTFDPKGIEGMVLATKDEIELENYEPLMARFPFVNPKLLVSSQRLDYYRQALDGRTQGLEADTFFRPTFLRDAGLLFPWTASFGN